MKNKKTNTRYGLTSLEISGSFVPLTEFGHITQQGIMPIIAIADGEIIPLGTCFAIQPDGFFMTAKHVIDGFSKQPVIRHDGNGYYKNFSLQVFQVTGYKHKSGKYKGEIIGGLRPINKVWLNESLDIAIGSLAPAQNKYHNEQIKLPCAKLSTSLPKIGENILGFGYYNSSAKKTTKIKDGKQVVDYHQDTAFTQGKVLEIFSPRRDSGMLNFPCFELDARFDHGMSGGPIFKEDGTVCGVICSSNTMNRPGDYISYGSLIWPSFGIQMDVKFDKNKPTQITNLYDFAKRKLISVDNIDALAIIHNSDGGKTIVLKKSDY